MKKHFLMTLVASLALGTTLLFAAEDHSAYRTMKIAECTECHKEANVAANHVVGWNVEHKFKASKADANCAVCHEQSFCLDCHQGGGIDRDLHTSQGRDTNYKPKSHRTDWREIHPIMAADSPRSCEKCHATKFCESCHAKFRPEELQFQSHRRGWSDLRTTPAGPRHATFTEAQCQTCHPNSVLPAHTWSREHAREARRDLASCQACHADGDTCLKCHSSRTGLKINPHPDNWGSIQGKLNKAAGQRTCVKCH
jgi:hypothetical protein